MQWGLHKKFNSSDCVNIRRKVSIQIALIAFFLAYSKIPEIISVFCLPVDFLTFRHKFDCCDAAINNFIVQQQQIKNNNKKTKNKINFHRGHHLQKLSCNVKKHLLTYHDCLSRVRVFMYMNIKLFYENTFNEKRNTH